MSEKLSKTKSAIVQVAIVLSSLATTNCGSDWQTPRQFTKEQVLAGLKDAKQPRFCAGGIAKDRSVIEVSRTEPPHDNVLVEGTYWVRIASDGIAFSEYYDDADMAVAALTKRGV